MLVSVNSVNWTVGGSWRKPTQTLGEHANCTQERPQADWTRDLFAVRWTNNRKKSLLTGRNLDQDRREPSCWWLARGRKRRKAEVNLHTLQYITKSFLHIKRLRTFRFLLLHNTKTVKSWKFTQTPEWTFVSFHTVLEFQTSFIQIPARFSITVYRRCLWPWEHHYSVCALFCGPASAMPNGMEWWDGAAADVWKSFSTVL